MATEPRYWKPDRDARIANFLALVQDFEKHFQKAIATGDKDQERIALTEMIRANLNAQAFMLLQRIDAGETSRDELTEWELTALAALDR